MKRFLLTLGLGVALISSSALAQRGGCEWCLPPEFEDQIHIEPGKKWGHYQPITQGKWYAMVVADAEFQIDVIGDVSSPDCEELEDEAHPQAHAMACAFEASGEGQMTVFVQAAGSPVNGSLSIGRSTKED